MDVGSLRHLVRAQNPGPAVPDGDGGYTQTWADLTPPTLHAKVTPATARDLERVTGGTVIASATHLVECRYHPQITTQTRLIFNGRMLSITYVGNPLEQNIELQLVCVEIVS